MNKINILKILISCVCGVTLCYFGRVLSGYKLIALDIFSFLVSLIFLYLTDIIIDYYFGGDSDDKK